jgi:phosphoglycerate dehydrogenase-like enzyme
MTGSRPRIALAMMSGLAGMAFRDEHWERLDTVGTIIDRDPIDSFDDVRAGEVLAEADVLLGHWGCPTLTAEALDRAPHLRLFAYAAGTVKWQVVDAVWERGLIVTSAAAANAVPVAEYTVAMIVLANKGIPLLAARERDPDALVPLSSRISNLGKKVGLVGASLVGRHVIELLRSYELEVAVADPYLGADEAKQLGVGLMELDELCAWCDVLSLHAPEIDSTRGMIGAAQLALLHRGAFLINTARGRLVDHDALLTELQAGRLAAVLDVTEPEPLPPDSPLRQLPNVLLTPHVAGATGTELWRLADLAVEEIERYAAGLPPRYPVVRADLDRIA